jgi:hypothetical protein
MLGDASDWKVAIVERGRCGHIDYSEGENALQFYWELGGDGVIAIILGTLPDEWDDAHPWARGRAREIMLRVAGEVVRLRAPGCRFDLDEVRSTIYVLAR